MRVVALLALLLPAQFDDGVGNTAASRYVSSAGVSGALYPSSVCSSSTTGDSVCMDSNGLQGTPYITDLAPQSLLVHAQDDSPTGAQTAAVTVIRGGLDEKKTTIGTAANCGTDNLTASCAVNNTSTSCVFAEATDWSKTNGDNNATGASLRAALGAASSCACINSTLIAAINDTITASAVAYVVPALAAERLALTTNDATCMTVSNGTDGGVLLAPVVSGSTSPTVSIGSTSTQLSANGNSLTIGPTGTITVITGTVSATLLTGTGSTNTIDVGNSSGYVSFYNGSARDLSAFRTTIDSTANLAVGTGNQTKLMDLNYGCRTVTGVNTNTLTLQTIFAVPSGYVFWPTQVTARNANAAITAATWMLDCTATNDTDDTGFGTMSFVTTNVASGTGTMTWFKTTAAGAECAAASNVAYDGVAAEAAGDTITVTVCGLFAG